MENIYKGYSAFDAMTQTDFFFRTDAKKRSAGMFKAAAECIVDHRLWRGLKIETAEQYDAMRDRLVKRMQELNALQPATLEYGQSEKWGKRGRFLELIFRRADSAKIMIWRMWCYAGKK